MQITVWKSEFEGEGEPAYQVSISGNNADDNPQIIAALFTHQQAWDRAIQEADAQRIPAVDEIDGDTYQPK